jgi:hypothetical protein
MAKMGRSHSKHRQVVRCPRNGSGLASTAHQRRSEASHEHRDTTGDRRTAGPARERERTLVQGELQSLPFPDDTFDAVTGFNSFQYAAGPHRGVARGQARHRAWRPSSRPRLESRRRCASSRRISRASARSYRRRRRARQGRSHCAAGTRSSFFATAGLEIDQVTDVPCTFAYRDTATAVAALSSAGPVIRIAEHAGWDAVRADIEVFPAAHVHLTGPTRSTTRFATA